MCPRGFLQVFQVAMKCCCLLLRSSSAQTPSFRCITSSSSERVNLSENCAIPDLQQLFDYTYFDIWRQASWEMPDTGHLPSTCAVTAGTHVALNDPSDWRDRDSCLSPGISLFFFLWLLHSECKIWWEYYSFLLIITNEDVLVNFVYSMSH